MIELMMVVSIIGVLASIAIPLFQRQALKTKQSEWHLYVQPLIEEGLQHYAATGKCPNDADYLSTEFSRSSIDPNRERWNPPYPERWKFLDGTPRGGSLYGSYAFYCSLSDVATSYLYVYARMNLDGDVREARLLEYYRKEPGQAWFRHSLSWSDTYNSPPGVF